MSAGLHPPKLAERLLKWYAGQADVEDLHGDLDELYLSQRSNRGKFKADIKYWYQVLSLLSSYALKKRKRNSNYSNYYALNSTAMIKNYFKIAIRNFSKHKLFTSLNIVGLALGMCICLLALSIAVAIYQSDEFHEHKDRIYQINTYLSDTEKNKPTGLLSMQ